MSRGSCSCLLVDDRQANRAAEKNTPFPTQRHKFAYHRVRQSSLEMIIVPLIFLCLVRAGSGHKSPEDFRVRGLANIEPAFGSFEGDMFSGLISARKKSDAELFFWLFTNDDSDSLVIWFNGGPGCSSIDAGLLFEMGPVTTPLHPAGFDNSQNGNHAPLTFNKYAWANVTNVMYIEQPVGVGYSHGSPQPQNEDEVAADFYHFLQNFFEIFPKMRKHRLFLVGESYAGMCWARLVIMTH